MRTNLKIWLAADTPLYAPLYLIFACSASTHENDRLTRVSPNWDIAPLAAPGTTEDMSPDPLINKCLVQYGQGDDRNAVRVGVGDPMRITSALKLTGFEEPLVVGCLINKVCLWAIDANAHFDRQQNFKRRINRLLVHPKGWTGYVVPFYQQVKMFNENPDALNDFLMPIEIPGQEREQYIRSCANQRGEKIAYITTNPLEGKCAATDEAEHKMVHNFAENKSFHDVIMSGLIMGKTSYYKDQSMEVVEDLRDGIKEAIARIMEAPDLVASVLWTYGQLLQKNEGRKIFCTDWSPNQTRECIAFMRNLEIFSSDLNVKNKYWERSKAIHKVYENYVGILDHGRSVDELHAGYYI